MSLGYLSIRIPVTSRVVYDGGACVQVPIGGRYGNFFACAHVLIMLIFCFGEKEKENKSRARKGWGCGDAPPPHCAAATISVAFAMISGSAAHGTTITSLLSTMPAGPPASAPMPLAAVPPPMPVGRVNHSVACSR